MERGSGFLEKKIFLPFCLLGILGLGIDLESTINEKLVLLFSLSSKVKLERKEERDWVFKRPF